LGNFTMTNKEKQTNYLPSQIEGYVVFIMTYI